MRRTVGTIVAVAVLVTGCVGNDAPTNEELGADTPRAGAPAAPNVDAASGGAGGGGAGSVRARADASRAWALLSDREQAAVCDRFESRGYTNTRRDLLAGKLILSGPQMTRLEADSTMFVIDQHCS